MNWQDVATALWLADTDTERAQADRLYRQQMRAELFGPTPGAELEPGSNPRYATASGVPFAEPSVEPEGLRPAVVQQAMDAVTAAARVVAEGVRPAYLASNGPVEGQIRSNAAGDGVEQYRNGLWQDVDPVDLFKYQRAVVDAQRGIPDPTPEVDPNTLPPVVHPVPDAETAYRHEVVLQQRRGNPPTAAPGAPSEPVQAPVVGSDQTPLPTDTQTLSAGDVNVQPQTPSVCGADTPQGPCTLAPHHPIGPMFPGFQGHLHTGD